MGAPKCRLAVSITSDKDCSRLKPLSFYASSICVAYQLTTRLAKGESDDRWSMGVTAAIPRKRCFQ